MKHQKLSILIEKCWDTKDIDNQFDLLKEINASLPFHDRISNALGKYGREFNWP